MGIVAPEGLTPELVSPLGSMLLVAMFIPICFLMEEQKTCISGLCYIAQLILWFCL